MLNSYEFSSAIDFVREKKEREAAGTVFSTLHYGEGRYIGMETESIYGNYEKVLPDVLARFCSELEVLNTQTRAKTGEGIYEHLISRVKSDESMREKCARRDLPATCRSALREITDAIGVRVITRFIEDIHEIAAYIGSLPDVEIVREKDYIRNAKPNGYRSYHMIVAYKAPWEDIDGQVPGVYYIEIQLRTIAMDSWASLEHQLKYKKNIRNQKLIVAELKRCADELAGCDLSMQTIRNLIRSAGADGEGKEG